MPGLLNLIAALSGHNDVQGGPIATTDPVTGEQVFTFNPYTAKGGFLSNFGTGRRMSDEMNARIGGDAFLQQEQGKRARALQKEAGIIEEGHIAKRGEQNIAQEKERGTQDRLTAQEKHKLESLLGKEKAQQIYDEIDLRYKLGVKEAKSKQHMDVLAKEGLPYSEEMVRSMTEDSGSPADGTFMPSLATQRLKNAMARESIADEVLTSPQGRKAAVFGGIQDNLKQAFINQRMSEMQMAPGSTGQYRDVFAKPPYGEPRRLEGKTPFETVEQVGGVTMQVMDPNTGELVPQTVGGKAIKTKGYSGGGNFPYADPTLMSKASTLSDTNTMTGSTSGGGFSPQELEALRKLLQGLNR